LTIAGDKRLELPTLAYSIHALTAVLVALCELFAFPAHTLKMSDKITLGAMYLPIHFVLGIMAIDMYKRINIRLAAVKQD
jgi:hypothetical protein